MERKEAKESKLAEEKLVHRVLLAMLDQEERQEVQDQVGLLVQQDYKVIEVILEPLGLKVRKEKWDQLVPLVALETEVQMDRLARLDKQAQLAKLV